MEDSVQPSAPGAVEAEISSISDSMFNADGTRNPAYWNDPQASERLGALLEQQRLSSSGGASPQRAEPAMHGYELGGLQGDAEFEGLAAVLHSFNAPAELMNGILQSFDDDADHGASGQVDREIAEVHLRQVWGDQYDEKVALGRSYLKRNLPDGVGDLLLGARMGGTALMNNPDVVALLVQHAERAPRMPAPTGDVAKDIAAIEKVMSDDPTAYRRDVGLQLRLHSLYEARQRAGKR